MDALGTAGAALVFVAFSASLMQLALRQRPGGGLFAALPLGLLPAALAFALNFRAPGTGSPELKALQAQMEQRAERLAASLPAAEREAGRKAFHDLARLVLDCLPGLGFCGSLALLAPLAAWLRRRQQRLGQAPPAPPLRRWTAPWGLVWLVLGPYACKLGVENEMLQAPGWVYRLALNLMLVGLAIYLFQGLVILLAKLRQWAARPATRALQGLAAAALGLALLLLDFRGLALGLVILGLLEPWLDWRRLKPRGGAGA